MSLINQMLRDLERQRKSGRSAQDSEWPVVNRPPAQEPGGRGRRIALLATVLVLASLTGWYLLSWSGRSVPPVPSTSPQMRAQVPPVPPVPTTEPRRLDTLVAVVPAAPARPALEPQKSSATAPSETPMPEPGPVRQAVTDRLAAAAGPPVERPAPVTRNEIVPAAAKSRSAPVPPAPAVEISKAQAPVTKSLRSSTPAEEAKRLFSAGMNALDQGRYPAAEKDFRDALARLPSHHLSREQLAALLLASGRVSEADRLLAEGLTLAPDHVPFRQAYARLLADRGSMVEAQALLGKAPTPVLAKAPDYYALLAALQQRLGQPEMAAATYRKLVIFNPQVGAWWFGLAAALEQAGANFEARQAYQAALQRPDLALALRNYAQDRLRQMSKRPEQLPTRP